MREGGTRNEPKRRLNGIARDTFSSNIYILSLKEENNDRNVTVQTIIRDNTATIEINLHFFFVELLERRVATELRQKVLRY